MLAIIIPDDVVVDFYSILTVIPQFRFSALALCRYHKIRPNRVLNYHPIRVFIAITACQIYRPNFMNPARPLFSVEYTPIKTDWASGG